MKRIYHPYHIWEDYLNGMYEERKDGKKQERIAQSVELLRNANELYAAMSYVANTWKYAAEVNLSNRGCNRQAWLGQAACCYVVHATEAEVRQAWNLLEDSERNAANTIADRVSYEWELKYAGKVV